MTLYPHCGFLFGRSTKVGHFSSYMDECVWSGSRAVYGDTRSKVRTSTLFSLDEALFLLANRLDLGVRRIPRTAPELHGRPPARSSLQKHMSVTLCQVTQVLVLEVEKTNWHPHSLELWKQVSFNRSRLSAPIQDSVFVANGRYKT